MTRALGADGGGLSRCEFFLELRTRRSRVPQKEMLWRVERSMGEGK